jgi:hypothetical protein
VCATLFYWQEILMELLFFFFIKLILASRPPVFMTTNRVTPNSPRLLGWPCLLVSRFLYPIQRVKNSPEKQFRFFFILIVFYLPHFFF